MKDSAIEVSAPSSPPGARQGVVVTDTDGVTTVLDAVRSDVVDTTGPATPSPASSPRGWPTESP